MQEAVSTREVTGSASAGGGRARAVYVLYLVGLVFWPVAIVGVVMAYLDSSADELAPGHRRLQIRTFWIGILHWASGFVVLATSYSFDPLVAIVGFLVPFLTPVGCLMLVLLFAIMSLLIVWEGTSGMLFDPIAWLWMPLAALLVWGLIWWTKRCVRGLHYLSQQQPYSNAGTWLW